MNPMSTKETIKQIKEKKGGLTPIRANVKFMIKYFERGIKDRSFKKDWHKETLAYFKKLDKNGVEWVS